jgi:putative FmdB family regulatory protein
MPTYGYRCEKNGHEFEVVQSMSDPPLRRCKICGSKVNRIFYPVGITFRGPGFYATDNRGGSTASTIGEKSDSDSKSDKADKTEVKAAKPDTKSKSGGDARHKSGSAAKKS